MSRLPRRAGSGISPKYWTLWPGIPRSGVTRTRRRSPTPLFSWSAISAAASPATRAFGRCRDPYHGLVAHCLTRGRIISPRISGILQRIRLQRGRPARSAVEEMAEIGKRLCSVAELADQDIGIQSERGPFIVVIHAAAITAIVSRNSGAVETVRGVRMLPRHCISRSYIQSRVGNVAFVRRGRPIAKTRAELKH